MDRRDICKRVGRETASAINPLISSLGPRETLAEVAALVEGLGLFAALSVDSPDDCHEDFMRHINSLTNTMAAALTYEASRMA